MMGESARRRGKERVDDDDGDDDEDEGKWLEANSHVTSRHVT